MHMMDRQANHTAGPGFRLMQPTRQLQHATLLVTALILTLANTPCTAQFGFGGGGGGMGGGGGGFGGGGGGGGGFGGGVKIDARGIVSTQFVTSRTRQLARKKAQALAKTHLAQDINRSSPLRMISLVRLEQACARYEDKTTAAPLDIQFLAGLQRIDYMFVDPDGNDLVIAGPAEGFAPDAQGRVVGVTTGRPPLRIDDLIVALRSGNSSRGLGVSIDPVPARLEQAKRFLKQNSSATSVSAIRSRFAQLARIIGPQTISVWGVPADSHFAQAMVEADIHMKLIALGVHPTKVAGLRSHLSLLKPQGNSMQRWWATPLYEAIYTTDDRLAFQLAGQRAQFHAQEELVGTGGQRTDAVVTRPTTRQFARIFTEKFPQLADRSPVFAELQNLIDLTILVGLLRKERLPERIGWNMAFFLSTERAKLAKGTVPKQIQSIYNTRSVRGRLVLGLVSGGVLLSPKQAVEQIPSKISDDKQFQQRRLKALKTTRPDTHPWWWD